MRRIIGVIATLLVAAIGIYFIFNFITNEENDEVFAIDNEPKEKEDISDYEDIPHKVGVPVDYEWELDIEKSIEEESEKYIKVLDEAEKEVDVEVELKDQNSTIHISNNDPYEKGKTYLVHFTEPLTVEDGEDLESGDQFRFTIDRDEVENITLNPDLIEIDKEDLQSINQTTVKIKKQKETIKEADILIVYPDEAPDGMAIKVVSINNKGNSHIIEYETPHFEELFEELDLYMNTHLDETHITPAEGVELTTAFVNDGPQFASNELPFKYSLKEEENKRVLNFSLEDGKIEIGGLPINLSGEVNLIDPQIITHSQIHLFKANTLEVVISNEFESEIKASIEKSSKSSDKDPSLSTKKIGDIYIPTNIPGIGVEGILELKLTFDLHGEIKTEIEFNFKDERGILFRGEGPEFINEYSPDFNMNLSGTAKLENQLGFLTTGKLMAFKVVGVGIEGFGGLESSSEVTAGDDTEIGKYGCFKSDIGPFLEGAFLLNIADYEKKYDIGKLSMSALSPNTCVDHFNGYTITDEEINLRSSEEKKVEFQGEYIELLTLDREDRNVDQGEDKPEIIIEDNDVIDVEIKGSELVVTAKEVPKKDKTNIIIAGEEDIVIPVVIKDYVEVLAKIEKEKEKEKSKTQHYEELMETYREAIREQWDQVKVNEKGIGPDYKPMVPFSKDYGFEIRDINNDGIPEMILGIPNQESEYPQIEMIYTLVDKKPVEVYRGTLRNRLDIFKDGTITGIDTHVNRPGIRTFLKLKSNEDPSLEVVNGYKGAWDGTDGQINSYQGVFYGFDDLKNGRESFINPGQILSRGEIEAMHEKYDKSGPMEHTFTKFIGE